MSLLYPNGFLFGQQQQQQQQQQQMLQQQQAQAQAQAQAAHNQAQAQLHQQQQHQQQKQHQVQQQQSSTARASLGGAQLAPSFGIAKPSIIGPAPAMRLSQQVTVGQHLTQDAASAQPQTPQQTQTRQHQVYSVQQGGALSASNGDVPIGVPQVRQSINYIQAGTPTANGSPSMLQNTWNQGISTTALKVNAVKDKDSVIIGLEKKVAEMEHMMRQKNAQIEALQKEVAALSMNSNIAKKGAAVQPRVTSGRASNGDYGRPLSMYKNGPITEQRPEHPYKCTDPNDPIDVRLEEFYNTTNSAIPFRRINKGWYRFGDTSVSLDIVNGKLMAKTDEGWNRGKLGDVEKFVIQYEPLERKKANIPYTQQF